MEFNPKFISNIQDIYGEDGDAWLKNLPHYIKQLSSLWDFHLISPMENLSYNFVGTVRMNATSQTAILKMAPKGGSLIPEMRWLNCLKKGIPELYKFDEDLNAFLRENLEPGYSLKTLVKAGDDDGATKIICETIRNIQSQPCAKDTFRHLSKLPIVLSTLDGKFDPKLLSKAKELFSDLCADRSHDVLLHGDLHHDNILSCRGGWKTIDPHGYIGDPAAEVGAMIRNAFDCFPSNHSVSKIVSRRLSILADELPFDPQKIKAWAFCITVLSGAWSAEDHGDVPDITLQVAKAINQATI
ncbi:MAG: streptomycin resistance protein [Alphaproteobacteria bacterium]|nr:streptomycin resistance protein [Alphaproteobacteria bacterium]